MFGRDQAQEACRRCSTCSIHYPDQQRFEICDVCQDETSRFTNVGPDKDWEERVEYAKTKPVVRSTRDPHEHRFEMYLKMGFGLDDSQRLANAVYGKSAMPLWHETVAAALRAGCSHELALDIFA